MNVETFPPAASLDFDDFEMGKKTLPDIDIQKIKVNGKTIHLSSLPFLDLVKIKKLVSSSLKEPLSSLSLSEKKITDISCEDSENKQILLTADVQRDIAQIVAEHLQNETSKYSFKATLPGFFKRNLIKLIAKIGSIAAIPFFILGRLGIGIYETLFVAYAKKLPSLKAKAKAAEGQKKFEALQKACQTVTGNNKDLFISQVLNQNKIDLHSLKTCRNKIARQLLRLLANHQGHLSRALIINLTHSIQQLPLKKNDLNDTSVLQAILLTAIPELENILTEDHLLLIQKELKATHSHYQKEISEDIMKLNALMTTLASIPKNYSNANKTAIKQLRELIDSPTYQALKEDPDNLYVKLIHKLSSAIWNDVKMLSEYEKFGAALLPANDMQQLIANGKSNRVILEEAHKQVKKEFDSDHGLFGKVYHAIKHPYCAIASMTSEGGIAREFAQAIPIIGDKIYDAHLKLGNHPFLQGTTSATIRTKQGAIKPKINNCYGGSPTIHDKIAPEFEALAQACENNQFAKIPDPTIPSLIFYTNLQKIEDNSGESERSFPLMQMGNRYPLSTKFITLSKDSIFYKMNGKYSNGKWKGVEGIKWPGAVNFGRQLKQAFMKEECFQYGSRNTSKTGNGIYLPGGDIEWNRILDRIVHHANKQFTVYDEFKPEEGVASAALRGAYQEYVYTMIQGCMEMKLSLEVAERSGNKEPLITSMRACKENIDRGGAENAKYIYTRLSKKPNGLPYTRQESLTLVSAALEFRALLVKDRTLLDDRLPQVLEFIELFKPEEIQDDLLRILRDLNIRFEYEGNPSFMPALDLGPGNPLPKIDNPSVDLIEDVEVVSDGDEIVFKS